MLVWGVPYAWHLVGDLAEQLHGSGADLADNRVPPPDEAAWGQLLRMMASDAMRGAVERHFGVRLAFQNCHRVPGRAPGPFGPWSGQLRPEACRNARAMTR